MFHFFRKRRRSAAVTFLEMHGYGGCTYHLTGETQNGVTRYSLRIYRNPEDPGAVLLHFTEDFSRADQFTRYLAHEGVRPEELPLYAAKFFDTEKLPAA